MITFDPLQFGAVAFVGCGLLAVFLEIALQDPRGLWDMINDVRDVAEHPKHAKYPKSAERYDPRLSA